MRTNLWPGFKDCTIRYCRRFPSPSISDYGEQTPHDDDYWDETPMDDYGQGDYGEERTEDVYDSNCHLDKISDSRLPDPLTIDVTPCYSTSSPNLIDPLTIDDSLRLSLAEDLSEAHRKARKCSTVVGAAKTSNRSSKVIIFLFIFRVSF